MVLSGEYTRVRIASMEPDIEMSQDLVNRIRDAMDDIDNEMHDDLFGGGPPKVLLNTETHDVWVSAGDWHDREVVKIIFDKLENIEGINSVDGESESYPDGFSHNGGPWQEIWPDLPEWAQIKE